MNDTVAAALLGLIQGLTEFLPVSSTAHLILGARALALDPERFGLSFDVALHLGTALAVLLYFHRTWLGLLRDLVRGRLTAPLLVLVGTLPAAVAGALLQSFVERELRGPLPIALGLVVGSLVFWLAERSQERRPASLDHGSGTEARSDLRSTTVVDALVMGGAQAIALLPGISRSGITISAGLGRGLARAHAARFSFLLAAPIIVGAGAKTALDARHLAALTAEPSTLALGFTVSFLAGLAAIAFLMRFLRSRSFLWFVPYRLGLAALVLLGVL